VATSIAAPPLDVRARAVLARLDAAVGREPEARDHVERAFVATEAPGIPASYVSAVHFAAGAVAGSFGTSADAEREFRLAAEIATAIGDTWAAERATRAAGELAARRP
jgi:hypothetical protein